MIVHPLPSNRDIWDSIAESFDTTRKKPWRQVLSFLESIHKTEYLIDLGCGNGRHLIKSTQQCTNVIGVDISKKLLQIAKKNMIKETIKNVTFLQATAIQLPFLSNSFGAGMYIAALHTLRTKQQRIQSLQELYRVLKPEKQALISVWNKDQERFKDIFQKNGNLRQNLLDGDIILHWRQHKLDIPRFYHLYEKDEFIDELLQAGFKIIYLDEATIASQKSVDNFFATVVKPG